MEARRARNGTAGGEPRSVAESVADVAELSKREERDAVTSERVAHRITLFSGSMPFVWLHVAWFAAWIVFNAGLLGITPFDEFPFVFLTMIVSLEAIFLSTFVLITQNRQSRESDRRAKIDLEINMIAEREITEALKALRSIQDHLGIEPDAGRELDEMQEKTRIGDLAERTDVAEGA
jgi:uncharacterized membrane protein